MWPSRAYGKPGPCPADDNRYPWELYGKYVYTEFVPLPDLISLVGDSTPRLLRYIHMLLNYTYGQNFDYITSRLKKFLLVQGKRTSLTKQ